LILSADSLLLNIQQLAAALPLPVEIGLETQGGRAAGQWVLPHHGPEKLRQKLNDV